MMRKTGLVILMLITLLILITSCQKLPPKPQEPEITPVVTPVKTETPPPKTPTATRILPFRPTPTATKTPSPRPTAIATPTPTASKSPTATKTPTAKKTIPPTVTATPTRTTTQTVTPTPPPTLTPTSEPTPTSMPWPAASCPKPSLRDGYAIGVAQSNGTDDPYIKLVRNHINWHEVEPQDGMWDEEAINAIRELIDHDICKGRTVVMVLVSPPQWATRNAQQGVGVPANLSDDIYDPNNYWTRFVREMARRFKDRVDHWIIWNEPDLQPPDPIYTWTGTDQEFLLLHKAAYFALKEENQNAKVHLAGISQWYSEWYINRILSLISQDPDAAAYGYYFNYASLHLYHGVWLYHHLITRWKLVMEYHGIVKPIWVTEANLIDRFFSDDQQASWVIEANAVTLAAGADAFIIFRWSDGVEISRTRNFGIEHTPAAEAFRTAVKYLSGPYDYTTFVQHNGVWVVVVHKGNQKITVLWNLSPRPTTIAIPVAPYADVRVVDKYDKDTDIPLHNNHLQFTFPGTTARAPNGEYWIGTGPYLIIETVPEIPESASQDDYLSEFE